MVKESEYEQSEDKNGIAKSITVESNAYEYYPVSLSLDTSTTGEVKGISSESNAYKLLFEGTNTAATRYWLGSSCIAAEDGYVGFCMRDIHNGYVRTFGLYATYPNAVGTITRGVRVVVSLKSDVQFIKTGENTYNISVTEENK